MRIWLGTIGEPWPTDGKHPRLLRTGIMARRYADGGDDVVWFNDTMHTHHKTYRYDRTTTLKLDERLTLIGLHGSGYRKNVSLARIRYNWQLAADFHRVARDLPRPDIIVASMPPLELAEAMLNYGREHDIPVITDIRDQWPEIWLEVAPKSLRPLARAVLTPFYAILSRLADRSSAITGVSDAMVDWALKHGRRSRNAFDGALPLAYEPPEISADAERDANAFWDRLGIAKKSGQLIVCFFGTLTRRVDIGTVLDAARLVEPAWRERIRIVMCGLGAWEEDVRRTAGETPVLVAPGWVDGAQIAALLKRSDVGLLPYFSTPDFQMNLPNKVFDYLTGGVPILTCLSGLAEELVTRKGCGWTYSSGDPQSLVRQLQCLADNPPEVAEAAANCREQAQNFSASAVYDRFHERLQTIIAANRADVMTGSWNLC